MLLGHGPNTTFLVPDSCRATDRNSNSINADVRDDTIENNIRMTLVIFREIGRCFGLFYIAG
jgi:hypothetical protein